MWVMLNDAFLSIVALPGKGQRRKLLVRARARYDISRVFADAVVQHTPLADYAYRAIIPAAEVKRTLAREVGRITYTNFKDSVAEEDRHDAYITVWTALMRWGRGLSQ